MNALTKAPWLEARSGSPSVRLTFFAAANASEQAWLEAFRMAGAVLIGVWCAVQAWLVRAATPHTVEKTATLSGLLAAWLNRIGASASFVVGALLALVILAGRAARPAAALLAALLACAPALAARDAAFDAPIASLTAAWLALLPVGRSLRVGTSAPRAATNPIPYTSALFALHLGFVYANGFFWHAAFPHWKGSTLVAVLAAAIPGLLLVARARRTRLLVAALQLCLHGAILLAWGHVFGNALMAATSLVVLARGAPRATTVASIDAGAACAFAWSVVVGLSLLDRVLGTEPTLRAAAALLHDLGPLARVYALY